MGIEKRESRTPKRFDDESFDKVKPKPIKAAKSIKIKDKKEKITSFVSAVSASRSNAPAPESVDDTVGDTVYDDGMLFQFSQESAATDVVEGNDGVASLGRTCSNVSSKSMNDSLCRSLSQTPGYYHLGEKNEVLAEGQEMLTANQLRSLAAREPASKSLAVKQWLQEELSKRAVTENNVVGHQK